MSPQVVDHYENPRNVGSLDRNAKNVGTGLVGAPACGDVMKLQVGTGDRGTKGSCEVQIHALSPQGCSEAFPSPHLLALKRPLGPCRPRPAPECTGSVRGALGCPVVVT